MDPETNEIKQEEDSEKVVESESDNKSVEELEKDIKLLKEDLQFSESIIKNMRSKLETVNAKVHEIGKLKNELKATEDMLQMLQEQSLASGVSDKENEKRVGDLENKLKLSDALIEELKIKADTTELNKKISLLNIEVTAKDKKIKELKKTGFSAALEKENEKLRKQLKTSGEMLELVQENSNASSSDSSASAELNNEISQLKRELKAAEDIVMSLQQQVNAPSKDQEDLIDTLKKELKDRVVAAAAKTQQRSYERLNFCHPPACQ